MTNFGAINFFNSAQVIGLLSLSKLEFTRLIKHQSFTHGD